MNGDDPRVYPAPLGLDPYSKVSPLPAMRGNYDRPTKPARDSSKENRARKAQRAARKRQRKG